MSSPQRADTENDVPTKDEEQDVSEHEEGSDPIDGSSGPTEGTGKPKKKKPKSKAAQVLNALRGKSEVPQELVDRVLDQVKGQQGEGSSADSESVRAALEQLKIMDFLQGKSGIGGKNKKDVGEHKFWRTQPVPQLGEESPQVDGAIEPSKPHDEVRKEPWSLPREFEWTTIDIADPKQCTEVHNLLSLNYVEDNEASFRFKYSAEFLEWALRTPGYYKEWHLGVRVASNKRLVAFIAGVPITLRVRGNTIFASEINYLCVHKKLRSKRLAPVLIKEVTRQCHLKGVFQAIYTAGVVLPTPVATSRYYHRSINIPKLVESRFTPIPRNLTLARMIRLYKLPSAPHIAGLREMQDKDIEEVADLFSRYSNRFDMAPIMTVEEIRYHFLSGRGTGEVTSERRNDQVVWSYVVENPRSHKVTDFFSFYSLPSTIIKQESAVLEMAYLYYYATTVAFEEGSDTDGRLKRRLQELIGDAVIIAEQAKFDVFNALALMDNASFFTDLKFGAGDGLLNFYLYNWRTAPIAGVQPIGGTPAGGGVGVVML